MCLAQSTHRCTSDVRTSVQSIGLGSLAELDMSDPMNLLYKSALQLGQLFDGGFWRHGSGAEAVAYIQNKATKTELLVFWNPDLKQVCVSSLLWQFVLAVFRVPGMQYVHVWLVAWFFLLLPPNFTI